MACGSIPFAVETRTAVDSTTRVTMEETGRPNRKNRNRWSRLNKPKRNAGSLGYSSSTSQRDWYAPIDSKYDNIAA